ncbi:N-acetylmuramoyl-L-alanine amidase [Streptomyces sp. NPDC059740]|uniref:peptidoglycan recognition protein family protein n=1 Tax=Streptomyces sp. NPDC059740 TaxID=3346926 RepID=UPI0036657A6F
MATPMTADQFVAQLKKWGLKYVGVGNWRTHNRAGHGAWGGVNGFIWHHTGATISAASAKTYAAGTLYNGRSDLPGPLCHASIGLDGTVYLVGWGRTNHAGGGDPKVLQHVINEDYTGQLHPTKGNANGTDGNAHFYGVEIQYSGSKKMAPAQYEAALRLSAAILDHHGWTEKSVIGHGEWSNDKWDPGCAPGKIMDMVAVRADVKKTLAGNPPATDSSKEIDDMSATDIYKAVWDQDKLPAPTRSTTVKSNPTWAPANALRETYDRIAELRDQLNHLTTLVETIAKKVG